MIQFWMILEIILEVRLQNCKRKLPSVQFCVTEMKDKEISVGNYRAMIRQICNVKPQDIVTVRSNELLAQLGIEDLDLILKERMLCWYGQVDRSNGGVKTAYDIQVDGKHEPGRPR